MNRKVYPWLLVDLPDRGRELRAGIRVAERVLSRGFARRGSGGPDVVVAAGADERGSACGVCARAFVRRLGALGCGDEWRFSLAMATIPSETVPPRRLATVLGLTMGLGEIIGGVFAPTLAGRAADSSGLGATLWILIGLSLATGLLACFIEETAPRVLQRRMPAVGHRASSVQS
jgi:MFS family permease